MAGNAECIQTRATAFFTSLPTLPHAVPVQSSIPPPDPHPSRAHTHAESSVRPTRGLTSDDRQKLHSPSQGRGVASPVNGAPPRRACAPGLCIFCLF